MNEMDAMRTRMMRMMVVVMRMVVVILFHLFYHQV